MERIKVLFFGTAIRFSPDQGNAKTFLIPVSKHKTFFVQEAL